MEIIHNLTTDGSLKIYQDTELNSFSFESCPTFSNIFSKESGADLFSMADLTEANGKDTGKEIPFDVAIS